jgi:HEAT repeat protein
MAAMVICRIWRVVGLSALVLATWAADGRADADDLPMSATVAVGQPPRPVRVRVEPGPEGGVQITAGRGPRKAAVDLPWAGATARVEAVTLRGGAAVAVVHVTGPGDERGAAVVAHRRGAPEILWSGRMDPHGDPGERRADVLEVNDRTGDGFPDVVVGRTRESTRICGQEQTLLFPRAVDPRTLTLRPVLLRRLPEEPATGERHVRASRESPGPEGPPLLDRLIFTAASSVTGGSDDPALVPAPVALVDGDASTTWQEGHGGDGKWEFVTGRFDGGRFPIRALAVTPSPADAEAAAGLGRPMTFWLVGDRGPRLKVTLPEDPLARPGEPYWIVPERPLHWRCLSIVLGEVTGPPGAAQGTVRAALAGVAAYTDLDFGEGLQRLVDDLGTPGASGAESAELLASVGPPALDALGDAWDALGPLARQRAVRTLRAHAAHSEPARSLLARAATDDTPRVRTAALRALEAAGPAAADALADLARRPDATGDRAAARLAATVPVRATGVLLALLDQAGGPGRPPLRAALARAVRDGGEPAVEHLRRWAAGTPGAPAAAAAALALGRVDPARPILTDLFERVAPGAERFEDHWRLVKASAHLPSSDALDAWLAGLAADAEEWMLRAAALPALAQRGGPAVPAVAAGALEDPYPRVRMAAVKAFGQAPAHLVAVATLARRDPWPMVRSAAVEALVAHPRARPVLRAAVKDPSARVRATAIGALATLGDGDAWPPVGERLRDGREDPAVVAAGIEFARTLCVAAAVPDLAARVDRAMAPDATPDEGDLGAAAVRALTALGGRGAQEALKRASGPAAPPTLRDTVIRARQHEAPCQ